MKVEGSTLAIVMMQKNEGPLLEAWLWYHCGIAGPSNIYVYDNGSIDKSTIRVLRRFSIIGVNIIYIHASQDDYQNKDKIILDKIQDLQMRGLHDFILPLDCDEFLGVISDESDRLSFEPMNILEALRQYTGTPGHFKASGSFFNVPKTARLFFYYEEDSIFFGRSRATYLEHGYHRARAEGDLEKPVHIPLVLLHFQFKNLSLAQAHAKEKMQGRITDFEPETLANYTGTKGSHLIRLLKMTPDTYTLSSVGGRISQEIPLFWSRLDGVGIEFPDAMFCE